MALVSLKTLLDEAAARNAAIPAFNVNNLEQVQAICEAARSVNAPVILQASAGARQYAGMIFLKGLLDSALKAYPELPICFHQDHGHSPETCYESIQAGFSSVMMDGSLMPDGKTPSTFDHNVQYTRAVVKVAHAVGVSVEGEIGCLGSLETGLAGEEDGSGAVGAGRGDFLTDPETALAFVEQTGVDALAVAIGTSHGVAKFYQPPTEEVICIDQLRKIHALMPNMHLVLHGSSSIDQNCLQQINQYGGRLPITYGVPVELLKKSIQYGVRKINIDTDLRLAVTAALRRFFSENPEQYDPRKYLAVARKEMITVCRERYEAFGASGWAERVI